MDEYIGRQAVIDVIGEVHPLDYNACAIKKRIEQISIADVRENKRGHWIEVEGGKNQCSECGHITNERIAVHIPVDDNYVSKGGVLFNRAWKHPYFCSQCGADMRKPKGTEG